MKILDAIRQHAFHTPGRVAVTSHEQTLTWEQLLRRSGQWGRLLRESGVGRGDRVATVAGNSCELLAAMVGAAGIGAATAPLNPALTTAELADLIEIVQPSLVVHDGEQAEIIVDGASRRRTLSLDRIAGALDPLEPFCDERVDGSEPFALYFTSGTTGVPKGAYHSQHKTVLDGLMMGLTLSMTPSDSVYLFLPLFHAGGYHSAQLALLVGGSVVLRRGFDVDDLLQSLRGGVSVVMGVPAVWNEVVRSVGSERFPRFRVAYIGGSVAGRPLLGELGRVFPNAGVYHAFGMTEAGPFVSVLRPEQAADRLGSVGMPLPGVEVRVLSDDRTELGQGEVGEIVVRAPTLMDGYWGQRELYEATIVDGWLHTGDIGCLDRDGFLYITDRKKDVIISKGETISSVEVERALALHPDVADVAVVGAPHPDYEEMVVAFVQRRPGVKIDEQRLLDAAAAQLARFKRPRRVIVVDELPRTALGKVAKPALRERLRNGG